MSTSFKQSIYDERYFILKTDRIKLTYNDLLFMPVFERKYYLNRVITDIVEENEKRQKNK